MNRFTRRDNANAATTAWPTVSFQLTVSMAIDLVTPEAYAKVATLGSTTKNESMEFERLLILTARFND